MEIMVIVNLVVSEFFSAPSELGLQYRKKSQS